MSFVEIIPVTEDEIGMRVDRWFKHHYPDLKHGRLEKLLRTGQIRIDRSRVKANARLCEGQEIRIPPVVQTNIKSTETNLSSNITKKDIEMIKESIIHMDNNILAINKPAGLAVQGGSRIVNNLDSMLDFLKFDADERPRLVHRLDKDTSGVLILARQRKSAVFLSEAFRTHKARKVYWAIVLGVPRPTIGLVELPLVKKRGLGGDKVVVDGEGKRAITRYRVIDNAARKAAWLSLEPLTGRTHQLRVHCNELGTPILGDRKYGHSSEFFNNFPENKRRLQLHAKGIRIPNPSGGILEILAPLPKHMVEIWQIFGFNEHQKGDLFLGDGGN